MHWRIELAEAAVKELRKLDPPAAKRIRDFLIRISKLDDPRSAGKALQGSKLGEFWRYRVGSYRLICSIEDNRLVILVLRIGDRKEIYR